MIVVNNLRINKLFMSYEFVFGSFPTRRQQNCHSVGPARVAATRVQVCPTPLVGP